MKICQKCDRPHDRDAEIAELATEINNLFVKSVKSGMHMMDVVEAVAVIMATNSEDQSDPDRCLADFVESIAVLRKIPKDQRPFSVFVIK